MLCSVAPGVPVNGIRADVRLDQRVWALAEAGVALTARRADAWMKLIVQRRTSEASIAGSPLLHPCHRPPLPATFGSRSRSAGTGSARPRSGSSPAASAARTFITPPRRLRHGADRADDPRPRDRRPHRRARLEVEGPAVGAIVIVDPASPCVQWSFYLWRHPVRSADMRFLGSAMRMPPCRAASRTYLLPARNAVPLEGSDVAAARSPSRWPTASTRWRRRRSLSPGPRHRHRHAARHAAGRHRRFAGGSRIVVLDIKAGRWPMLSAWRADRAHAIPRRTRARWIFAGRDIRNGSRAW